MRFRLLAVVVLVGCRSNRGNDQLPLVQTSSGAAASRIVTITALGNFSPPCLAVDLGDTVEWDNPTERVTNVTSASVRNRPPELYSPSLVASAVKWRHTFNAPGRVDYFDQNGAGGGAIDPYYGTRVLGGRSGGAEGTVCVRRADGTGCQALCCLKGGGLEQCTGKRCVVPADPEIAYGFCDTSGSGEPFDAAVSD